VGADFQEFPRTGVIVNDFVMYGCGANWMPLGPQLNSGSTALTRLRIENSEGCFGFLATRSRNTVLWMIEAGSG
jgi:hypothetical protein